jgi:hypothetical protein
MERSHWLQDRPADLELPSLLRLPKPEHRSHATAIDGRLTQRVSGFERWGARLRVLPPILVSPMGRILCVSLSRLRWARQIYW